MSNFKIRLEQNDSKVSVQFIGDFPERLRNKGKLFEASNGVIILSVGRPQIVTDVCPVLFCPGFTLKADQDIAFIVCEYKEDADLLYKFLLDAILEWSAA